MGWFSKSAKSNKIDTNRLRREEKIKSLLPQEDESNKLRRGYDFGLLKRLGHYILIYKQKITLALIFMSITSFFGITGPWIIGKVIDSGIKGGDLLQIRFLSITFIVVMFLEWMTNRTRIILMAYVGTKVVADLRSEIFNHLHSLPLTFHNNYKVGRLMSRLISDVNVLQEFVTWSITGVVRAVFMLVGITGVMLTLNWQLALITLTVLPLMIIITNRWQKQVRHAYRATRQRLSLINGYLNESISGIRVTQSFTREQTNYQHFNDLDLAYFEANVDSARLTALFFPSVDFMGALATALVIGVGGWLVLQSTLTAGTLITFVLYINNLFEPIKDLAQRYDTFQSTMAASERVFDLLDTPPSLQDAPNAFILPPIKGNVAFKNVNFSYNIEQPVLHNITLTAQPGQRIALVGETGAGKSTIIRLLARFFDVKDGAILIDGYDLRHVTQASLRSQLGIVLQDTFLFSGSIADNIRYGRLEATDEEIETAAKAVGAHQFINQLPNKYQMDVGENGINLSVGQRQIISFARALLANPRILILDEATSSVDTTTEKQIDQALDHLMIGRTSFIIAHRLNTIVTADKIIVLDQGKIIEMGTHQQLLAQQGQYYHLYTMQWAR